MSPNPTTDRSVFLAAIDIASPAERDAFVARACGENAQLRADVQSLLAAHGQSGDLLDAPDLAARTMDSPVSERPGTQIGPYKLLQQIGEGGMGIVYMAEQTEPIARRVALKIIKPGMDTRQVIARFEAERQALAMMDHVNIARVLDAGTTPAGLPYFVMELVHGVPITQYCDDQRLTPRERLELFVPVCQAIQHAHQKGIIHRDIKPSNVMVTLYDGQPVPKVIDFGVAKATEQRLTEQTLFTQYGTLVGTLEYMSPEQAEMSALGVDTRSDIFSLGVLLYELLTGSTPLSHKRLKEAAYGEVLRMIREEEAPKPSTRLSDSGEALASISAQRHTEPAKLSKLMRGELDWIVMKTLEKDRNRRYETANGFAADVQRYLNDEPVQACPPSAMYRFRKFARRNRAALTVGVLLALSLLVMVAGITAGVGWAVRDRAARDEQAARELTARQAKVSVQLERILDEVTQLEQEGKWSKALVSARRGQPLLVGGEAAADIREHVQKALGELEFVQRLDDIRAEGGSVWGEPTDRMAVADREYANAFREFGIDLDALPQAEAADRIKSCRSILPAVLTAIDDWVVVRNLSTGGSEVRRLVEVINVVDPDPWRQSLRSALASKDWAAIHLLAKSADLDKQSAATLYALGAALRAAGEFPLEIDVLRRAQWRYPGDYWINHRLGISLIWLKSPDRVAEGIGYMRASIALRPESSHALMNLGNGHRVLGRYDEAEACYRKAIELNPKSAIVHHSLGNVLVGQKKLDEAVAAYRKATELNPKFAAAHINLGNVLLSQKKLDEAIAAYRKAIELDPKSAKAHDNLGTALHRKGELDEAIAAYRKAIELNPKFAAAHINLGNVLLSQKKLDEAIAAYRKAIELDPKSAKAHDNLGTALHRKGELDEAIAAYRKAIELDPKSAKAHGNLGTALHRKGELDEAIAAYRKAIELDPKSAATHNNLGVALKDKGLKFVNQKKLDQAIACWQEAVKLLRTDFTTHCYLALALTQAGKLDEAIGPSRKAVELKLDDAGANNQLAWLLATCPDLKLRDPKEAVVRASKAVEVRPKEGAYWNTLGVACYRTGDWKATSAALEKSMELRKGGDSFDWFFLAMTHFQMGEKDKAREWYGRAVEWIDKNQPNNAELRRFRSEAEELLGIEDAAKPK